MKFFHYTKPEQFEFLRSLLQKHYPDVEFQETNSHSKYFIKIPGSDLTALYLGDRIVLSHYPKVVSENRWPSYSNSFSEPLEEILTETRKFLNPNLSWEHLNRPFPESKESMKDRIIQEWEGVLSQFPDYVKGSIHWANPGFPALEFSLCSPHNHTVIPFSIFGGGGVEVSESRLTLRATDTALPLIFNKAGDWTTEETVEKSLVSRIESDPLGKSQHEKGSKLDNGKLEPSLILGSMSEALNAVIQVAQYGKQKYIENGWLEVPNAEKRYTDAMLRHYLAEQQEDFDKDSGLLHSAHLAWNALARLHFILQRVNH